MTEPYAHVGVHHEDERPGLTCDECEDIHDDKRSMLAQNFQDNWGSLMFLSVPGGNSVPRLAGGRGNSLTPRDSQRKFDNDLYAYESSRKGGLQPDQSTKAGVERVERRVESFARVEKKHKSGEIELSDPVHRVMKQAMGD